MTIPIGLPIIDALIHGGDAIFQEDVVGEIVDEVWSDVPPHLHALLDAVDHVDVDALRTALDNSSGSIDEPLEDHGDTALHLTCLYGGLSCVQLLLERGASPEVKNEHGGFPLHHACAGGVSEIVQLLISIVDDPQCMKKMIETADAEGDTPLHHAAMCDHVEVIRLLLSYGASPLISNARGKTPIDIAGSHTAAREVLVAAAGTVPRQ